MKLEKINIPLIFKLNLLSYDMHIMNIETLESKISQMFEKQNLRNNSRMRPAKLLKIAQNMFRIIFYYILLLILTDDLIIMKLSSFEIFEIMNFFFEIRTIFDDVISGQDDVNGF